MSPDDPDLLGFMAGLRHRLAGPEADRALARRLDDAETALRAGQTARARTILIGVADILDSRRAEPELRERPRGLLAFRTAGDEPVQPTPADEDPVANRLVLVGRLLAVRGPAVAHRDELLRQLRAAEAEHRAGRTEAARRLIDEVHAQLDRGVDADGPQP